MAYSRLRLLINLVLALLCVLLCGCQNNGGPETDSSSILSEISKLDSPVLNSIQFEDAGDGSVVGYSEMRQGELLGAIQLPNPEAFEFISTDYDDKSFDTEFVSQAIRIKFTDYEAKGDTKLRSMVRVRMTERRLWKEIRQE